MTYNMYRDVNNQWRWRLVAENNRTIANSGEEKLREEHKAGRIVAALDALHPDFYPKPCTQNVLPEGGGFQLVGRRKGFLTKPELMILHGRCGGYLHRGSLDQLISSPLVGQSASLSDVVTWTNEVDNLLSLHILALFDGNTHFMCMLRNANDAGRVQVAFCEYFPTPPRPSR